MRRSRTINGYAELQNHIAALSAEVTAKAAEILQTAADMGRIAKEVDAVFSDQDAGQEIAAELAQAVNAANTAAYEIYLFDVRAQEVIHTFYE